MAAPSYTYSLANGTTADASQVMQNFTDILNGVSDGTKDLSINALTCAGTVALNGNTTIGNASSDDLTVTASLASSIPIKTTNSYNIGSSTLGLASIYLGANSQTVRILPSASMSATWTLTLPTTAGTNNYVLTTNGSGTTSWAQASLTAGVTGTLPIANGGTGQTSASSAFDALSPMSTLGDIIYGGASGTRTRLAGNATTTPRFLRSVGDGASAAAPGWAIVDKSDISGLTDSSSPTFAAVTITGSSGSVYSGTYTPTLTGDSNISATTAFTCNYMRIQNQVMVTGKFNADPVSSGIGTAIGVSLPIASDFTNDRDCSGTGCTDTYNPTNITADTTNNRATITFTPTGTANSEHRFFFMYLVQ